MSNIQLDRLIRCTGATDYFSVMPSEIQKLIMDINRKAEVTQMLDLLNDEIARRDEQSRSISTIGYLVNIDNDDSNILFRSNMDSYHVRFQLPRYVKSGIPELTVNLFDGSYKCIQHSTRQDLVPSYQLSDNLITMMRNVFTINHPHGQCIRDCIRKHKDNKDRILINKASTGFSDD